MKRILRSSGVDQSTGTTIYTVPPGETASVEGLRFVVSNLPTDVTVSHFVDATGVTTTYTMHLNASDQMSDDTVFALAENDYVKVQSSAAGVTYYANITIP